MERMHSTIRVPKTAELVADRLRRQIIRGELREGDSLPPEADLMAAYGISRPTLREAFRVLESEGLIDVHRGSRGGARASAFRPRRSSRATRVWCSGRRERPSPT